MVKIMDVNLNYLPFQNMKLSFQEGKIYFVVGDIKSGKEELLNILSGIMITNNMVSCNNCFLNQKNRNHYVKYIGVLKKVNEYSFKYQRVLDEMLYPLINLSYSKDIGIKRIKELLNIFKLDIIDKKISELDSLNKQKLLLVISLLHYPKVLLIENIFSLFSDDDKKQIFQGLKELVTKEKLTIINFTSSLEDALFSDKILLLSNYKIVKEMSCQDIIPNDKLLNDNNIEIPFLYNLYIKLKMYDIISKDYFDMKEMVDYIWK